MQTSRRRGNRALITRKHRLVIGAVTLVGGAAAGNIRRQRHITAFFKRLIKRRAMKRKRERHLTALAFGFDRGVELVEEADAALAAKAHNIADLQPLGWSHESEPARAVEPF